MGGFDLLFLILKIGEGDGAKKCRQLLEAGNGPQLTASKETGSGSYSYKELYSANNLNEQGSGFSSRAPRK